MVALGAMSPALARATSAGALGESSGPRCCDRDVARTAEAEATVEAPALVGDARSRFTEAPTPAVPASPRESAICEGWSEGRGLDCDASASAGLSMAVGEAVAAAMFALRAGRAEGAACGLALGTAAVWARVGEGRAAARDGLDAGAERTSGFCVIAGLLVACRAIVDAVGRTSAAAEDAAGALAGAGAAATSLTFGLDWTALRCPGCGEGVCATLGAVSAGSRRAAARDAAGDSEAAAGAGDGCAAPAASAGDSVACRATAVLVGRGVALAVDSAAPGVGAVAACVAANAVSCGACRRAGSAAGAADAVAGDG
jgi:hypothetical protein